jgi:hypothetical protein
MNYYDYIIIGSDPYGLTCAYYLSKLQKKILLIDEDKKIGGNYNVNRINNLYSDDNNYYDSYVNFKNLLKNFGYNFYSLFNQKKNNLYYPKIPTDYGLYNIWTNNLIKTNNFLLKLNTKINKFNFENNNIKSIILNNEIFFSNNYIFSKYIIKNDYINIFFHWNSHIKLQKNNNYIITDWMITYNILSDYIYFYNINSITVISITINLLNVKSKIINKTANESNDIELINDSFRQLKQLLINLPKPNSSIINKKKNKNNYNLNFENIKNIKIFNDNFYNIESLIINGIKTVNEFEKNNKKIKIYRDDNIIEIIQFLFLIFFILYIFRKSLQ